MLITTKKYFIYYNWKFDVFFILKSKIWHYICKTQPSNL